MQLSTEQVARICHEANRAYCVALGDTSQPSWDDAPDWQKKSAMNGVDYLAEDMFAEPPDSHANWLKMKEADGWVYGEVKDVAKKTHPCMVPYHELPVEQQRKDALFSAIVEVFVDLIPV